MPEIRPTDVELGSIGITKDVQLKLRSRTLPGIQPHLELSNWSPEMKYHLGCPFPDDPQVIKALIGALQDHLVREHGPV
jgi:hypothetical protein